MGKNVEISGMTGHRGSKDFKLLTCYWLSQISKLFKFSSLWDILQPVGHFPISIITFSNMIEICININKLYSWMEQYILLLPSVYKPCNHWASELTHMT